jgi:nitrogen fixation-related uncharacterized protein
VTSSDIDCGIITVILFIAWLALDYYGWKTGQFDDEE